MNYLNRVSVVCALSLISYLYIPKSSTMILDIKRTIIRKNLATLITTMVMLIAVVTLLFVPFQSDLINGLSNNMLALFFAAAYVINAFYNTFRNYNYIYFNDESDKIVLRYFSPAIFTNKKNSIEIPKREFAGYKLSSFFLRYRESIILFRNTGKGIAKYPKVSITALNKEQRNSLLDSLNALWLKNQKK